MSSKVSVIIPVYNAENTIEKCVESIVYGELRDIEVILVDDCSFDNSWGVCESLSKRYKNVYCYQNSQNRGVSYTRNHGLMKSKGEYILFVDSDDWVSSKYGINLLNYAENNKDAMVICGLHFIDNVAGYKRVYLWHENGRNSYCIGRQYFFDLHKKFLIQQLWNKIFRRDVIENNGISFDEAQTMGEDFQFVLDYMEAIQCKRCVILNEPLYYYIRANNTSLMSKFGMIENENEYKRLGKLLDISGKNDSIAQCNYRIAVKSTKENYIYQCVRNSHFNKKQKLEFIEMVMHDGNAKSYYYQQIKIMKKESIVTLIHSAHELFNRLQGKIQRIKNKRIIGRNKKKLEVDNLTIISQNCIGGVFYHDMGLQFQSPTINLFFEAADFVKFVLNLEYYLNMELKMLWAEEYPVGILGDIKIYFMHYQTCTEAKQAWEIRKKRIDKSKILVLSTDRDDFSESIYNEWKNIKYRKVLFSATDRNDKESVFFPKYKNMCKVADLIPRREFYKDGILLAYANKVNDDYKSH